MEKVYAKALLAQIAKGADEKKAVDALVAHLAREGKSKLLPGILRALKNEEAALNKSGARLEVASESEKSQALAAAKAEGIETDRVSVNPALIKGWRAQKAGLLIDRSGKKALIELYRNIVTN